MVVTVILVLVILKNYEQIFSKFQPNFRSQNILGKITAYKPYIGFHAILTKH